MEIAVLIPCYNEEISIGNVIDDFRKKLPKAKIYVYDNNSTDKTSQIAREKGVIVNFEEKKGKGNVVRKMFRDIEADIFIMVDGDNTYPAKFIHQLIKPIVNLDADMVVGDRLSNGTYKIENKRRFHNFGNNLVKILINRLFKADLRDIMSGYRVFNRKFVKNITIRSNGFEIETEMTLYALDKYFRIKEIEIDYYDRAEGSKSKLNTLSDGFSVLKTIIWIFKDYKPLVFFSYLSLFFFLFSLIMGIPVIVEFSLTGFISKMPSAILSTGLMLLSILSLFSGFILDTIAKNHKEIYLSLMKIKKQ
jgi:glycosyltransferase involved in cell wall biosynthesis